MESSYFTFAIPLFIFTVAFSTPFSCCNAVSILFTQFPQLIPLIFIVAFSIVNHSLNVNIVSCDDDLNNYIDQEHNYIPPLPQHLFSLFLTLLPAAQHLYNSRLPLKSIQRLSFLPLYYK